VKADDPLPVVHVRRCKERLLSPVRDLHVSASTGGAGGGANPPGALPGPIHDTRHPVVCDAARH
jgi:hypothetical protein